MNMIDGFVPFSRVLFKGGCLNAICPPWCLDPSQRRRARHPCRISRHIGVWYDSENGSHDHPSAVFHRPAAVD
jgi:hypothetical protein